MSADKGTFGAANMELFDEESEIDVRPQHYEAETNKVDFNIYVGSLNTKLELSPDGARRLAEELTSAADAAGEAATEE